MENDTEHYGRNTDEEIAPAGSFRSKLTCKVCRRVFTRPSKLLAHQNAHEGKRSFACKVEGCDKSYIRRQHLVAHEQRCHQSKALYEVRLMCPEPSCKLDFKDRTTLKKHFKRWHDLKCEECNIKFTKKLQLKSHNSLVHLGAQPFRCDKCNITFSLRSQLNKHNRRHRTFTCPHEECKNITFDRFVDFRMHNKAAHYQPKLFTCSQCEAVFKIKKNLVNHLEVHKLPKDRMIFKCTYKYCARFYFLERNLKAHIKSYHEGLQYECDLCGRKLVSKKKIYEHMKAVHQPVKRKARKRKKSKKRSDSGKAKKSFAVKLSGLKIPYSEEKKILLESHAVFNDTLESTNEITKLIPTFPAGISEAQNLLSENKNMKPCGDQETSDILDNPNVCYNDVKMKITSDSNVIQGGSENNDDMSNTVCSSIKICSQNVDDIVDGRNNNNVTHCLFEDLLWCSESNVREKHVTDIYSEVKSDVNSNNKTDFLAVSKNGAVQNSSDVANESFSAFSVKKPLHTYSCKRGKRRRSEEDVSVRKKKAIDKDVLIDKENFNESYESFKCGASRCSSSETSSLLCSSSCSEEMSNRKSSSCQQLGKNDNSVFCGRFPLDSEDDNDSCQLVIDEDYASSDQDLSLRANKMTVNLKDSNKNITEQNKRIASPINKDYMLKTSSPSNQCMPFISETLREDTAVDIRNLKTVDQVTNKKSELEGEVSSHNLNHENQKLVKVSRKLKRPESSKNNSFAIPSTDYVKSLLTNNIKENLINMIHNVDTCKTKERCDMQTASNDKGEKISVNQIDTVMSSTSGKLKEISENSMTLKVTKTLTKTKNIPSNKTTDKKSLQNNKKFPSSKFESQNLAGNKLRIKNKTKKCEGKHAVKKKQNKNETGIIKSIVKNDFTVYSEKCCEDNNSSIVSKKNENVIDNICESPELINRMEKYTAGSTFQNELPKLVSALKNYSKYISGSSKKKIHDIFGKSDNNITSDQVITGVDHGNLSSDVKVKVAKSKRKSINLRHNIQSNINKQTKNSGENIIELDSGVLVSVTNNKTSNNTKHLESISTKTEARSDELPQKNVQESSIDINEIINRVTKEIETKQTACQKEDKNNEYFNISEKNHLDIDCNIIPNTNKKDVNVKSMLEKDINEIRSNDVKLNTRVNKKGKKNQAKNKTVQDYFYKLDTKNKEILKDNSKDTNVGSLHGEKSKPDAVKCAENSISVNGILPVKNLNDVMDVLKNVSKSRLRNTVKVKSNKKARGKKFGRINYDLLISETQHSIETIQRIDVFAEAHGKEMKESQKHVTENKLEDLNVYKNMSSEPINNKQNCKNVSEPANKENNIDIKNSESTGGKRLNTKVKGKSKRKATKENTSPITNNRQNLNFTSTPSSNNDTNNICEITIDVPSDKVKVTGGLISQNLIETSNAITENIKENLTSICLLTSEPVSQNTNNSGKTMKNKITKMKNNAKLKEEISSRKKGSRKKVTGKLIEHSLLNTENLDEDNVFNSNLHNIANDDCETPGMKDNMTTSNIVKDKVVENMPPTTDNYETFQATAQYKDNINQKSIIQRPPANGKKIEDDDFKEMFKDNGGHNTKMIEIEDHTKIDIMHVETEANSTSNSWHLNQKNNIISKDQNLVIEIEEDNSPNYTENIIETSEVIDGEENTTCKQGDDSLVIVPSEVEDVSPRDKDACNDMTYTEERHGEKITDSGGDCIALNPEIENENNDVSKFIKEDFVTQDKKIQNEENHKYDNDSLIVELSDDEEDNVQDSLIVELSDDEEDNIQASADNNIGTKSQNKRQEHKIKNNFIREDTNNPIIINCEEVEDEKAVKLNETNNDMTICIDQTKSEEPVTCIDGENNKAVDGILKVKSHRNITLKTVNINNSVVDIQKNENKNVMCKSKNDDNDKVDAQLIENLQDIQNNSDCDDTRVDTKWVKNPEKCILEGGHKILENLGAMSEDGMRKIETKNIIDVDSTKLNNAVFTEQVEITNAAPKAVKSSIDVEKKQSKSENFVTAKVDGNEYTGEVQQSNDNILCCKDERTIKYGKIQNITPNGNEIAEKTVEEWRIIHDNKKDKMQAAIEHIDNSKYVMQNREEKIDVTVNLEMTHSNENNDSVFIERAKEKESMNVQVEINTSVISKSGEKMDRVDLQRMEKKESAIKTSQDNNVAVEEIINSCNSLSNADLENKTYKNINKRKSLSITNTLKRSRSASVSLDHEVFDNFSSRNFENVNTQRGRYKRSNSTDSGHFVNTNDAECKYDRNALLTDRRAEMESSCISECEVISNNDNITDVKQISKNNKLDSENGSNNIIRVTLEAITQSNSHVSDNDSSNMLIGQENEHKNTVDWNTNDKIGLHESKCVTLDNLMNNDLKVDEKHAESEMNASSIAVHKRQIERKTSVVTEKFSSNQSKSDKNSENIMSNNDYSANSQLLSISETNVTAPSICTKSDEKDDGHVCVSPDLIMALSNDLHNFSLPTISQSQSVVQNLNDQCLANQSVSDDSSRNIDRFNTENHINQKITCDINRGKFKKLASKVKELYRQPNCFYEGDPKLRKFLVYLRYLYFKYRTVLYPNHFHESAEKILPSGTSGASDTFTLSNSDSRHSQRHVKLLDEIRLQVNDFMKHLLSSSPEDHEKGTGFPWITDNNVPEQGECRSRKDVFSNLSNDDFMNSKLESRSRKHSYSCLSGNTIVDPEPNSVSSSLNDRLSTSKAINENVLDNFINARFENVNTQRGRYRRCNSADPSIPESCYETSDKYLYGSDQLAAKESDITRTSNPIYERSENLDVHISVSNNSCSCAMYNTLNKCYCKNMLNTPLKQSGVSCFSKDASQNCSDTYFYNEKHCATISNICNSQESSSSVICDKNIEVPSMFQVSNVEKSVAESAGFTVPVSSNNYVLTTDKLPQYGESIMLTDDSRYIFLHLDPNINGADFV